MSNDIKKPKGLSKFQAEADARAKGAVDGPPSSGPSFFATRERLAEGVKKSAPAAAAAGAARPPRQGFALKPFATFEALKNTEYLWDERIPLGCLTMVAAEPGVGKSTMLYYLIARWSRGLPMPDGAPSQVIEILILSAEDHPDDSAGPKLQAAGADLGKIHTPDIRFDIRQHAKLLEETLIANPNIKLVMIEPIAEQVEGNSNDVIDVSKAMGTLQDIAQRRNVAIVGVHHFNKSAATSFAQKMLGSVAFYGKARVAWGIHKPRANPDRRILALGKSNCRVSDEALQFSIERCEVPGPDNVMLKTARVIWHDGERLKTTMDDLLQEQNGEAARLAKDPKEWLQTYLAPGPRLCEEVLKAGRAAGFTENQLNYARTRIGAGSEKVPGTLDGGWYWHAAGDDTPYEPASERLPFTMK